MSQLKGKIVKAKTKQAKNKNKKEIQKWKGWNNEELHRSTSGHMDIYVYIYISRNES